MNPGKNPNADDATIGHSGDLFNDLFGSDNESLTNTVLDGYDSDGLDLVDDDALRDFDIDHGGQLLSVNVQSVFEADVQSNSMPRANGNGKRRVEREGS